MLNNHITILIIIFIAFILNYNLKDYIESDYFKDPFELLGL